MDNFWFIFAVCVLSIALGVLGTVFYITVVKNYDIEFSFPKKKEEVEIPKEEYTDDDTKTYDLKELNHHSSNIKAKCLMGVIFVLCAIVGGYFGYTMMKNVDSIIKENHHQYKTLTMVIVEPDGIIVTTPKPIDSDVLYL